MSHIRPHISPFLKFKHLLSNFWRVSGLVSNPISGKCGVNIPQAAGLYRWTRRIYVHRRLCMWMYFWWSRKLSHRVPTLIHLVAQERTCDPQSHETSAQWHRPKEVNYACRCMLILAVTVSRMKLQDERQIWWHFLNCCGYYFVIWLQTPPRHSLCSVGRISSGLSGLHGKANLRLEQE